MIIQWAPGEAIVNGNVSQCRKLGSFQGWVNMKVEVRDASIFYFAPDKQTLMNPLNGVQGGSSVKTGDGVKEFWITGDVYAVVSSPVAQVNVDFFGTGMNVNEA